MSDPAYLPSTCPGCGLALPAAPAGVTHRYIGASAACWTLYTAQLDAATDPLLVDAYAAQHPGEPGPQAIQSVAVHLLALYAVLEQRAPAASALTVRRRALRTRGAYAWLTPPASIGRWTIQDVARGPGARADREREYAASVWASWRAVHHQTVRVWFERFVVAEAGGGRGR